MSSGFRSGLRRALGTIKGVVAARTAAPGAEQAAEHDTTDPAATSPHQAEEVRVFRRGRIRLLYEITRRPGKPLIVVFSSVDTVPGRCGTSYYALHWQLDATVVHIHDNFGAHGNYLLRIAKDHEIGWATVSLLRQLMRETGTSASNLWLVGSSKGATTALCMALMLRGGNCIAAEPQIMLGDFFYPDSRDWRAQEDLRAMAYAMMGRVDERDRVELNAIVPTLFRRWLPKYTGKALVLYGKRTGYYERHIVHLDNALSDLAAQDPDAHERLRLTLRAERFDTHTDVVPVFLDHVLRQFGMHPPGAQNIAPASPERPQP